MGAAVAAVMVAVVAGGLGGWGLHHVTGAGSARPGSSGGTGTPNVQPQNPQTLPAVPQRRRVVLAGDSLLYGSGLEPPQDLPSALAALRPELDVIDTAVGGSGSADVLSRTRQLRLLHADEAVLWIGGQDADDKVPLAAYRANLEQIIAALSPARIVLVTPVADYATSPSGFAPYAAAVRDIAAAQHLQLVDLGSLPRGQYQADGQHLDAATDAAVARQISAAL